MVVGGCFGVVNVVVVEAPALVVVEGVSFVLVGVINRGADVVVVLVVAVVGPSMMTNVGVVFVGSVGPDEVSRASVFLASVVVGGSVLVSAEIRQIIMDTLNDKNQTYLTF